MNTAAATTNCPQIIALIAVGQPHQWLPTQRNELFKIICVGGLRGGWGGRAMSVAALFVRSDSIYKTMPNVDAWDIDRDARKWPGGCPVVAHPPCSGWTLGIHQSDFGHRATKATRLYIVGCDPRDLPELPALKLGGGTHVIAQDTRKGNGGKRLKAGDLGWRPFVTHAEREHTPPELARWLVELAAKCARTPSVTQTEPAK